MPKAHNHNTQSTASVCSNRNQEVHEEGISQGVADDDARENNVCMDLFGLYLYGVVCERTKRMIPKDNPTTEIVTYNVLDTNSNKRYFVDDYAPESYFKVGEYISTPVYVKPYRKKNNELSYMLCIHKDFHSAIGQPF